ncbi:Emopamil-binding [Penicillium camemberti]|uniref:Emopamil-binding n=1 Tax=Penicillium camemberti (strain FM 013) TaxID=1429867 RepID=A0A0G4PQ83_PENC3|nr:Emopamil-binding [Penicillium camemberti]
MADPVQFTNTATSVSHNYYPPTIHLPQYVDNETPAVSIIIQFGFLWAAVLGTALIIICRVRPTASKSDKLAFVWMCLSSQELFGQLWKEYSLSDSRSLTSDAFLVSMESVTAFGWGPLAFCIAYCITVQHPARYALQLVISVGQIYGDVLYYATSLLEVSYCRPERYYFWFYYFFFNFIWMLVGCYYASQSIAEITMAFAKLEDLKKKQTNLKTDAPLKQGD